MDASKEGLGAVLSQKQVDWWFHLVAYGSWALTAHEKNYHSAKLEFLALKWAFTEHLNKYLLYQTFLVKTDNNPLTYSMTTPNLDATGHQWVGALAKFNFQLEYQKGWDNAVADALSWITTCLGQEAVQAVLDGATIGASQIAEGENPTVIEGDQQREKEVWVAAGQVLVEMHVTNWVAAQKEDPELHAVLQWFEFKKKTDLRTLLGEHTLSKEGRMVWRNHQNFTTLQGNLYLCSIPKGENEDLLLFMVLKTHQTATLNGCHQDAGHQGHDHTLSLLQECFWWPGMAKQMRQVIKACKHCLQYEDGTPKAPLCPIVPTTPLDLLHVDFTSIETMLELNQLPRVTNVLVFQDHFTKHVLAYVTPDQTAKTIAKFLYGGYISILGALARLLSDRGTSFISSIIEELCKILGIQWLQTMPYHPQTNGPVERSHQVIMHMIGKLGEDKKADLPSHLAEIAHAYNAIQSTVTRYSPHYLMFGWWPRLLVDFVFPTVGSNEAPTREASAKSVDVYVASVRDRLRSTLWEVQAQSMMEAHRQKWYYNRKIGAVNLKPGNLVLVKANAWKGKRKIKDRWEEETWEVVHQIAADVPSYKVTSQHGWSWVHNQNQLLLVMSEVGIPLCMGNHHTQDRCTSPTSHKTTSIGGDEMRMPQEKDGKVVTWWPTSKASWGGKTGSYSLDHGHLPECPLRTGEDHR